VIYVEYISRRTGVGIEEFHQTLLAAQTGWDAEHGEDVLLWAGGRTWRIGPEPEYLTIWHSPGFGLERLDGWDAFFRAGGAARHAQGFARVARIDRAGCYEALLPGAPAERTVPAAPAPDNGGTYYVEFIRAAAPLAAVTAAYQERASKLAQHDARIRLDLLAHRIGKLAPDPGGIALWTLPSLGALTALATDLDGQREPAELVAAGVYADVGREIL
jgi:hypothetical protein